ncbi:phosphoglycolate phosphatase [Ruegeria sediminis]|uniref:Phosphoglycolate phosphatase n=1 Tax=Ruegeria sediminis TaxID=2583820 RepID=A0ABY2X3W4_9RHOB|nr:phosphoglycolate phosphatase [Ruegeria sediminis]TMV10081.1 phosphoglycolate phosphatase [Ruegeria sediminis]
MRAAIVFDLDGTLVDSAPDIAAAVNRMLDGEGRPALPLAVVIGFIGNGIPKLVERVIAHCGLERDRHADLTQATLDHYSRAASDRTVVYPGVVPALEELRSRGHALGICTNKPEAPARHVLQALGLAGFFDAVIGGDTLATRKPHPDPLHAAYAALPAGPRLYVGDSEVDAETARRAGVPFLLFTEGYRKSPVQDLHHAASYGHGAALPELVDRVLALADRPADGF